MEGPRQWTEPTQEGGWDACGGGGGAGGGRLSPSCWLLSKAGRGARWSRGLIPAGSSDVPRATVLHPDARLSVSVCSHGCATPASWGSLLRRLLVARPGIGSGPGLRPHFQLLAPSCLSLDSGLLPFHGSALQPSHRRPPLPGYPSLPGGLLLHGPIRAPAPGSSPGALCPATSICSSKDLAADSLGNFLLLCIFSPPGAPPLGVLPASMSQVGSQGWLPLGLLASSCPPWA